jgi:hypothetical protein
MPDHSRRSPGRPRRPEGALRVHTLRVSVSTPELDQIRVRARARGLRAGPYLRRAAVLGSSETDALITTLSRLLLELRGLASNFNQYSHRANLLIADARGSGRQLDTAALAAEQAAMVERAQAIESTATAAREALSQITGRAS